MYGDDNSNPAYPGGGLLASMLKAYQLASMVRGYKEHQADRQFELTRRQQEQTQFQNEQADRTRRQQYEDFTNDLNLREHGLTPVAPDAATAAPKISTASPFSGIQLPNGFLKDVIVKNQATGKAYRAPTQDERDERDFGKKVRLASVEEELKAKPMVPVPIPENIQHVFGGRDQLMVEQGKEPAYLKWFEQMGKGNLKVHAGAGGLVAYDEDTIRERLRKSPDGVVTVPTPDLVRPGADRYSEKQKNAAHLQALQWFRQAYPNGKTTDEFERGVKAYAADNGVDEDQARKALVSSKRSRDRYGIGDVWVKDPTKDLEFQQRRERFLDSTATPGAARPKVTAQTAAQQVDRYAQLRSLPDSDPHALNEGQRAEAESALVEDLVSGGVVKNERDARAYIQRKLGDNIQVPDSGGKTVYVEAIPAFAKKYFGGDELKANSWLNDRGYRLMQKVGGAQQ